MMVDVKDISTRSWTAYKHRLGIYSDAGVRTLYIGISKEIERLFGSYITSYSPSITSDPSIHWFVGLGDKAACIEVHLDGGKVLFEGMGFGYEGSCNIRDVRAFWGCFENMGVKFSNRLKIKI